jgi:molecular chaperone DnaK
VIGIDLGTTNSCVAVVDGGTPVVITNSEGNRTTPSVVSFQKDNNRVVGQVAKRQSVTNPQNTLFGIKRLIGRKFSSEEIQNDLNKLPFKVVEGDNSDAVVEVEENDNMVRYHPAEISAMILSKMKQTAEDYLGATVSEAIITVPAYFNDAQRQATKDAGRIAGLKVKRIVNEPTAAALAYGLDKDHSGDTIAVFDLGGGTFDISILEIDEGVFQVRSTNGDTHLGGEDFDLRIVDYLVEQFKNDNGVDLSQDPMALQRLKESAEKAKIELSSAMETEINLPFITATSDGPLHLQMKMTRAKLNALVDGILRRVEHPCKTALKDAKVEPSDLSAVVLVGGMTRMPLVQDIVKEIFGKDPHRGVNPDEVVAMGAAIQGAVMQGELNEVLLLDVTPLSLGIETLGGVFTKLIQKNTTIPVSKSQVFSTAHDNQSSVGIHVLQGERGLAADNRTLGKFELTDIPPAPRAVPKIEVSFDIDANGIVSVLARNLDTGAIQSIKCTAASGLSDEEIQRMVQDAEQHAEEDKKQQELIQTRNSADQYLCSVESTLHNSKDKLDSALIDSLESAIKDVRQKMTENNLEDLKNSLEQLQILSHQMSEVLYESVNVSNSEDPVQEEPAFEEDVKQAV